MQTRFNRWSSLIALGLSIVAIGFSVMTYWRAPYIAYQKVSFHVGIVNGATDRALHFCDKSNGENGFDLCRSLIEDASSQVATLRTAIDREAQHLSQPEYDASRLAVDTALASIATARVYLATNQQRQDKTGQR